jgi:hypothetical protein
LLFTFPGHPLTNAHHPEVDLLSSTEPAQSTMPVNEEIDTRGRRRKKHPNFETPTDERSTPAAAEVKERATTIILTKNAAL